MILINLLPHREMAREQARRAYQGNLVAAAILGALVAGLGYLWLQNQVGQQQSRNAYVQSEISKLDAQIREVANLEDEIAALRARQEAVEGLQQDRNMPVHLLNEAVRELPDGIYLSGIKQNGHTVLITGVAQSNERVSELLRNLSRNQEWLNKPELIEIVSSRMTTPNQEQHRVYDFTVRVQLQRPGGSDSDPDSDSSTRTAQAAAAPA